MQRVVKSVLFIDIYKEPAAFAPMVQSIGVSCDWFRSEDVLPYSSMGDPAHGELLHQLGNTRTPLAGREGRSARVFGPAGLLSRLLHGHQPAAKGDR